jgi:DNA-binding beta-propeller fold protein YncE
MTHRFSLIKTIKIITIILLSAISTCLLSQTLELSATITINNLTGRISHMAYNPKTQLLYVAALSNNTLEVVDIQNKKVVSSVKSLRQPQDVVYIPTTDMLFVACLGDGLCKGFLANTLRESRTQNIGINVNTVRYSPKLNYLLVGHGNGAINIYDANSIKLKASIPLPARPEAFVVDENSKKIFVNIPKTKTVEVIDIASNKVVKSWKIDPLSENYPMAFDSINHRLFIGCRNPSKLAVFDISSGKNIAMIDIDGDVNDLFYNAQKKEIYASCGDGYIDIIKQETKTIKQEIKTKAPAQSTKSTTNKGVKTPAKNTKATNTRVETKLVKQDTYNNVSRIYTADGARTCLFVPDINQLFVAVPANASKDAQILIYNIK